MKRKAFTLVELLVVVGIVALLVAILTPSLTRARSQARSAVCQSNLHQLDQGFEASYNLRISGGGQYSQVGALYPEGTRWPGTPMDSTKTEGIYKCPEDETMPAWSSLSNLKYLPPPGFGVTVDLSAPDNGMWIMSRSGEDDKGAYRDFAIQDDGSVGAMSWHGWLDIDGLFRVYESGLIWIMTSIPNIPEYSGAYTSSPGVRDRASSCGDYNRIFLGDKPAFGTDGCVQTYRGQKFQMEDWDSNTNYAINSYAYLSRKSLRVVLVDYKKKLIADPDTGAATEQLLHDSARHLGRLNVLMSDRSVINMPPMALSPQTDLGNWK